MMIEGFLLGIIVTGSLIAAMFFLKFWKQTHDFLFLAFGVAFLVEAVNRMGFLFVTSPNEGPVLCDPPLGVLAYSERHYLQKREAVAVSDG